MTLLHVIARGKIGRSPENEMVQRYEKRITWPLRITELPEKGGNIPPAKQPYRMVLLDEKGRDLSSQEFAEMIGKWRDEGVQEIRLMIGAADGHSEEERTKADVLIAYGSATWPHLMVRSMLMEQLYRASAILAGHPYHRAG